MIFSTDRAQLGALISGGVGVHHAGLEREVRTEVEDAFRNKIIQVLVATQTLAVGVNLPADCVVVLGTEYFNCALGDYADLPPEQVQQMIGRAGRPQYSTSGNAWVLCTGEQAHKYYSSKF